MEQLVWSKALQTGNDRIDEQHRELITRVNRFQLDCVAGVSRADLAILLDQLVDYSRSHFAEEEAVFIGAALEDVHKEEHQQFIDQLIRLQGEFGSRNPELDLEMLKFLQRWLVDHIQRMDMNTLQSQTGV